ncbi:MAG: hypothetical protein ACUVWR_19240 [Anaerolineae bacterium]
MPLQLAGPQGQVLALNDSALSQSLLIALERRYLYGVPQLGLRPMETDPNLMANARFLRLQEVAHSSDLIRSLHPLNMQNVLSSFRDGSHSLVFFIGGQESRTNVYLGLYKADVASHAVTPFTVAPQHRQHLAFCYLVNSGAQRLHILQGFQEAGAKTGATDEHGQKQI